jgi:hypothetical protein
MNFPTNPFHTLQRWMGDNARRAEAARRAAEAAKRTANVPHSQPQQGPVPSKLRHWIDWYSGKPGARRP